MASQQSIMNNMMMWRDPWTRMTAVREPSIESEMNEKTLSVTSTPSSFYCKDLEVSFFVLVNTVKMLAWESEAMLVQVLTQRIV